eukprot:NODE_344_length_1608_cov_104.439568_g312_i0.p1 GENE.NODE_344_length_1608_cov_104.439568_g312_i0~~NODE_344_length_1608_cov_104.439568_g312_i0.p1  ORF type:complete len:309 (-),score=35.69 NODE_344_length_1608_cov_104.439568_g312_i0:491-1417(-)
MAQPLYTAHGYFPDRPPAPPMPAALAAYSPQQLHSPTRVTLGPGRPTQYSSRHPLSADYPAPQYPVYGAPAASVPLPPQPTPSMPQEPHSPPQELGGAFSPQRLAARPPPGQPVDFGGYPVLSQTQIESPHGGRPGRSFPTSPSYPSPTSANPATVLKYFREKFQDIDEPVLQDIVASITSGGISALEAEELLSEMYVIRDVQAEAAKAIETAGGQELTVYTSHINAIRKQGDDIRRLLHLLNALHIRFNEVDIAENRWLLGRLRQLSGINTLPMVFVDQTFVGTFDTLNEWNEDGILMDRLREFGYR